MKGFSSNRMNSSERTTSKMNNGLENDVY